jgi:hypothetical protein
MRTSITILALALSVAAPAAAQAPAPTPAPTPMSAPTTAPTIYSAPSYAPSYAYAPRGRPERVQTGVRTERQTDRGLWGGGIGLFLAGWVLDFAVLTPLANAMSTDRTDAAEQDAWAWSLLPIAGPVIQLGVGAPHPAIPITTGLMQIGGLVMFILGMTTFHDTEVPVYAFGDPHDPRTARLSMDVSPMGDGAYATLTLHTM